MINVAIVMPAYNEEKRIGNTLEAYSNYFEELRKNKELDYEILIVINNTKDKTEEIVKKYKEKNNQIKYLNFKQGGKGFAIIEGFKDALNRNNDLIGFVDADLATTPEAFHYLIKNMSNNCDGAIASRYIKGSIVKPKPTIRRIIASRIFNFLIRTLLFMPYRDTQCGAKIFKREAIERTLPLLSMSKWAFDVDLIYSLRKLKYKIKEFRTIWSDMKYSKINFISSGPWMALGVIRLRLLNSPLKDFIRIYDKLLNRIWRLK